MKNLTCPECRSDMFYVEAPHQRGNAAETYCCANGHICTMQYRMVKVKPAYSARTTPLVALNASELAALT